MTEYDAWVIARLLCGQACNGELDAVSGPMKPLATYVDSIPLNERSPAWEGYLCGRADRADTIQAVTSADPMGSAPKPTATDSEVPIPIPEWVAPPHGAAFHGLAGQIVKVFEPHTEADPLGLLVELLIGYGNALGRGVYVRADGHNHHANEFGVLAGETARARKGTAKRRTASVLKHADPMWNGYKDCGGLSTGEGLINAVKDASWGVDKKTNKPVITDPGVDDKRFIANETEFGSVLRCLRRENNTLSAVMRKAWDGESLDSKVKGSPIKATDPHISMMGHIKVEELLKYLDEVEVFNGFGNRILWVCVRRQKELPFSTDPDLSEIDPLQRKLAEAVKHAQGRGEIRMADSARQMWESGYSALTAAKLGLYGKLVSRSEAHVLRLAMIYATLDKAQLIEDTHLLSALDLWGYCDRSARFLFGTSTGNQDADLILKWLQTRPDGMTRTEINSDVFKRNKSKEEIARLLGLLVHHNLIRELDDPANKHAPKRWFAVFLDALRTTNFTNSSPKAGRAGGVNSLNS
jgi:hypothetical protein